jgi:hypothetical protein
MSVSRQDSVLAIADVMPCPFDYFWIISMCDDFFDLLTFFVSQLKGIEFWHTFSLTVSKIPFESLL